MAINTLFDSPVNQQNNSNQSQNSNPLNSTLKSQINLQLPDLSNFISVKLEADGSNYLNWRNQLESILITTDLYDYVDGSIEEPVQFIKTDGEKALNPGYYTWRKYNRFVVYLCFRYFATSFS